MTENYPEFVPFPKIPRLHKECVVTEKIDGTIKINSLKNGGTTIFVTCPIQIENNEHKI